MYEPPNRYINGLIKKATQTLPESQGILWYNFYWKQFSSFWANRGQSHILLYIKLLLLLLYNSINHLLFAMHM